MRHTDEGPSSTINVFVALTHRVVRICFPEPERVDEIVELQAGAALFFNTNVVHRGCINDDDSMILFFSFDLPGNREGGKG